MKAYLITLCLVTGLWDATRAQTQFTQPGIDVLHYRFAVTLSDTSNQIEAEATIRFRFTGKMANSVWFDLVGMASDTSRHGMRVRTVHGSGAIPIAFSHEKNRLQLTLSRNALAEQTVVIRYAGMPAKGLFIGKNKFGERVFFGDNWPNNARYWLPVVDHPSDKATCEFLVTAPAHYRVVANGKLMAETSITPAYKQTHWQETVPIATKGMVIGVARFATQAVGTVDGIPVQSWLYPGDSVRGFAGFSLAKPILRWFTNHIGPYPFEKLANIQSATIFGGAENPGTIFYYDKVVDLQTSYLEGLLAHEIAHQWFGNSATEANWSDLWLSEGFATYFSTLYLGHVYGRDTLNSLLNTHKGYILKYTAQRPGGVVIDTTTHDLMALLNPNPYNKGEWVLHMLRYELGDKAFWKGIRTYYSRFKFGNAQTRDFQAVMEAVSGRSLTQFFDQWLYQPGYPQLSWQWRYDDAKKALRIVVRQQQPGDTRYVLPVVFAIQKRAGQHPNKKLTVQLSEPTQEWTIPVKSKPFRVVINPDNNMLLTAHQLE